MSTAESTTVQMQASRLIQLVSDLRRVWGEDFKRGQAIAGLSETQFQVLQLLGRLRGEVGGRAGSSDSSPIGTLAARLGLNPATIVRAVDSLEKKQLVRRRRSAIDRRQVHVEITERGIAVRAEMLARFHDRLAHLLEHMDPEAVGGLLAGLEALTSAARELRNISTRRKGS